MDQTYLDQQQLDANVNHQQLSQDTNLIPQQQLQQQQQPLQQLQQYQQQPLSNANFSGDNRFQQYQPRVTPSVSSSQQSIHTTTGYVTMHSGNYTLVNNMVCQINTLYSNNNHHDNNHMKRILILSVIILMIEH